MERYQAQAGARNTMVMENGLDSLVRERTLEILADSLDSSQNGILENLR